MDEGLGPANDLKYELPNPADVEKLSELETLRRKLMIGPQAGEFYNSAATFSEKLKNKYSPANLESVALFHVLGGSGMLKPPEALDLSSEDSIETFLWEQAKKYNIKV